MHLGNRGKGLGSDLQRGRKRGREEDMEAVLARVPSVASIATRNIAGSSKRLGSTPALLTAPLGHRLATMTTPATHGGPSSCRRRATSICACAATTTAAMEAATTRKGLIAPDGGVLVDLHVSEQERDAKRSEAEALPQILLSKVDLEWVHVVAEGWASPLKGFMRQQEYLQALHFNCLRMPDGSLVNMSIPIVLAIDDEKKEQLSGATSVALVGPAGDLVAILRKYDDELYT